MTACRSASIRLGDESNWINCLKKMYIGGSAAECDLQLVARMRGMPRRRRCRCGGGARAGLDQPLLQLADLLVVLRPLGQQA